MRTPRSSRHRSAPDPARRARAATAAVVVAAAVVFVTSPVAAQQPSEPDTSLRVVDSSLTDETMAIDLILPRADTGRPVPESAFSVNGTQPPPDVSRFNESLAVDFVLGAPQAGEDARNAGELAALRSAVTELLARLAPEVRVRIMSAGGVSDAGTDRAAAATALRALTTDSGDGVAPVIADAPAVGGDSSRAVIVFATEGTDLLLTALRGADPDESTTTSPAMLWHVQPVGLPGQPLTLMRASIRGGAPIDEVGHPPNMLAAVDRVALEMAGGYRLLVPNVSPGATLEVRVASANGTSTVTVQAPTSSPAVPPRAGADAPPAGPRPAGDPAQPNSATPATAGDDGGRGWLVPVAVLVLLLAAATTVAAVLFARKRSRAKRARATEDSKSVPPPFGETVPSVSPPAYSDAGAGPAVGAPAWVGPVAGAPSSGPVATYPPAVADAPAALLATAPPAAAHAPAAPAVPVGPVSPPGAWPASVAPAEAGIPSGPQIRPSGSWSGPEFTGSPVPLAGPPTTTPPPSWPPDGTVVTAEQFASGATPAAEVHSPGTPSPAEWSPDGVMQPASSWSSASAAPDEPAAPEVPAPSTAVGSPPRLWLVPIEPSDGPFGQARPAPHEPLSAASPPPEGGRGLIDLTAAGGDDGAAAARRDAAAHVDYALALLATQRTTSVQSIPVGLLIALEAVNSARFDHAQSTDEIGRLLASGGPGPDDSAERRARAIATALRHADLPAADLAGRIAEILEPSDERGTVDARFRAPIRTAARRSLTGRSIVEEAAAIVEGGTPEGAPVDSGLTAAVGRCLLSTWPARHGHLDGVPLVVSPSLRPGPVSLEAGTEPDTDPVVTVLAAVSDAVGRMTDAEAAYDSLHFSYRSRLRSLTAKTEEADRLASLITRRPVLDVFVASTRLRRTTGAARTLLTELCREGWLVHHDHVVVEPGDQGESGSRPISGPLETWVAHEVIDAVTGPFADSRFPPAAMDLLVTRPAAPSTAGPTDVRRQVHT